MLRNLQGIGFWQRFNLNVPQKGSPISDQRIKKIGSGKILFSKVKNRSPSFISIHHRNFNVSCSPSKKAPCGIPRYRRYVNINWFLTSFDTVNLALSEQIRCWAIMDVIHVLKQIAHILVKAPLFEKQM
jgi:hypothetical protein